MLEIRQVTPDVIYGRSPAFPALAYAGIEDGKLVAAGGLCWTGGRVWLWVDHVDPELTNPLTLVRWGKRMLKVAERYGDIVVSAARDPAHPNSEKLLKLLGFERVPGELIDRTTELWECRVFR